MGLDIRIVLLHLSAWVWDWRWLEEMDGRALTRAEEGRFGLDLRSVSLVSV